MKRITFCIAICIAFFGCGSATKPGLSIDNSHTTNIAAPSPIPIPVGPNPTATPSPAPRSYTNSYDNNYCDRTTLDLECWGTVTVNTTAVLQLFIGQNMICVSHRWSLNDITDRTLECYSAIAGPIQMDAHLVSGINNPNTQAFATLNVNTQGQICFKIDELNSSNVVTAIYNVCGSAPTINGGIQ